MQDQNARSKPVETLLAVNAFKRDASDFNGNPLTRALAVRTMGCLGVEQIMQFLCDPLKDALNDKDPYVRKTGAICVAKIYDINSQLVDEQFGFIDKLQNMLEEESNAMVIANCICSLIEISTTKGEDMLHINWKKCRHLMGALHYMKIMNGHKYIYWKVYLNIFLKNKMKLMKLLKEYYHVYHILILVLYYQLLKY